MRLGIGGLELRVQVGLVVDRVDEAVQALTGVHVGTVDDRRRVSGREAGCRSGRPGRLEIPEAGFH
jgi:hypothetical protein